jgi:hypothetical protein
MPPPSVTRPELTRLRFDCGWHFDFYSVFLEASGFSRFLSSVEGWDLNIELYGLHHIHV